MEAMEELTFDDLSAHEPVPMPMPTLGMWQPPNYLPKVKENILMAADEDSSVDSDKDEPSPYKQFLKKKIKVLEEDVPIPEKQGDLPIQEDYELPWDEIVNMAPNQPQEWPTKLHQGLGFIVVYDVVTGTGGNVRNNPKKYLSLKLKVEVPNSLELATVKYIFKIVTSDGTTRWIGGRSNSQTHSFDDGRSSGPGPQGMNYYYHDLNDLVPHASEGKIKIRLEIKEITKKMDLGKIVWRLKEKLLPSEQTELEGLRSESEYLEKELLDFQKQKKKFQEELVKIQKKIAEKDQIHDKLTAISNDSKKVNSEHRVAITGLQNQIMELEKRLKVCNIDEFLRKFDEKQVVFEKFSAEQLKILLTNILKLQVRISNQIIEEEVCAVCMENRRNVALDPCGHLYFCITCSDLLSNQSEPLCPICMKPYSSSLKVKF